MRRATLRVCECGAQGYIVLDEGGVQPGGKPKIAAVRGELNVKDGVVFCSRCGKRVALEDSA
jgi:hypothetical protein